MLENYNLKEINEPLLRWYEEHKRVLPWRSEPTPYHVWVSEIMLQQTRVEAVKPYYTRFLNALPTIQDLAECPEEKLLKLWEGLGYYNRVRNMQIAARAVMEEYAGELPADYEALKALKGIGHYTAGAIASIAYGIPEPAVDGNVLRVIARLSEDNTDIQKQSFRGRMEDAIRHAMPQDVPGAYNQALMELGAIICGPNKEPLCEECPLQDLCNAYKNHRVLDYPVKSKAKARRIEKKTVMVIQDGDKVVLHQRPKNGLLAGMYEFPNLDGKCTKKQVLTYVKEKGLEPLRIEPMEDAKHIFSHVEWHMVGYVIQVAQMEEQMQDVLLVEVRDCMENYPIPSAFEKYKAYLERRTI